MSLRQNFPGPRLSICLGELFSHQGHKAQKTGRINSRICIVTPLTNRTYTLACLTLVIHGVVINSIPLNRRGQAEGEKREPRQGTSGFLPSQQNALELNE